MRKLLFVVLDGVADDPLPALGERTPLEAARTPLLDQFARRGQQGQMSTVAPDVAPESDAAVMSLLGYDVDTHYTGRGPLEALGMGLDVRDGDLAWRGNFATVDDSWNILDRRVGRSLGDGDASELAAAIQKDVHLPGASLQFVHTGGHRACLVIRSIGGRLNAEVENVDPAYRRRGRYSVAVASPEDRAQRPAALAEDEGARQAEELTMSFLEQAREVLRDHPVNQRRRDLGFLPGDFVLLRDAGDHLPKLEPFARLHGLQMGAVVDLPVERALATLVGMDLAKVNRSTGNLERDYNDFALRTEESLATSDGVYVHIKDPDIPSHDGDVEEKVRTIEAIDRLYFGRLAELVRVDELLICVTADHATPVTTQAHSNSPVPVLVFGGVEPDGAGSFSEASAAKGGFGYLMGTELMPRLAELAKGSG